MTRSSLFGPPGPEGTVPFARHGAAAALLGLASTAFAAGCGGAPEGPGSSAPAPGPATREQPSSPASPTTVLDGVYSEAQAARGQDVFRSVCSECHESLEFRGDRFLLSWEGTSVGRFLTRLMETMPDGAPNSLPTGQYVDVTAYILQLNGFPTGPHELDATPGALDGILIERAGGEGP